MDAIVTAVAAFVAGGGIVRLVQEVRRWREGNRAGEEARATADAGVRAAEVSRDERVQVEVIRAERGESERLWTALREVQQQQHECEEQRHRDREQCDREIQSVRAEVRGELARRDHEVSRLTSLIAQRWRDEGLDDTGVHEVEELSRTTSTPPGAYRLPEDP